MLKRFRHNDAVNTNKKRSRFVDLVALSVFSLFSPLTHADDTHCIYVDEQEINNIIYDPQPYFNDIQLTPRVEDAQWQGYQVTFLRASSWSETFGFETGDLITAINGVSITDFAAFNQAIKQIPTQPQFSVTLERNHQAEQIHFLYGADAICPSQESTELTQAEATIPSQQSFANNEMFNE